MTSGRCSPRCCHQPGQQAGRGAWTCGRFPRLRVIWAEAGYAGRLVAWVQPQTGWRLEIVKRPRGSRTFAVLPRRWVAERPLGWLGHARRLSKDDEAVPASTAAWIHLVLIQLMLKTVPTDLTSLFTHPLSVTYLPGRTGGETHPARGYPSCPPLHPANPDADHPYGKLRSGRGGWSSISRRLAVS